MANNQFINLLHHPVKFRMFLFSNLPAAFFSGAKLKYVDDEKCEVEIRYTWFTRNPFRSTYFACLSMAAEMSTGILAMQNVYGRKPRVSMLVTKVYGDYRKRAVGRTIFVCEQGAAIKNAVEEAVHTKAAKTISLNSTGLNENGEIVADFVIEWSFKSK